MGKIFFVFIVLFATGVFASGFDFYQTKSKSTVPIIVFVHGGAWLSGSKEQYKFVGDLLNNDFCVAVVDYSLAPKTKHPDQVHELNEIVVKLNGLKKKNCDNNKIFLVGHSAGAHMIAFWNTAFSNAAVKGFAGLEGIYDIPNLAKVWPSYKDWFLTSEFGNENNWAKASPSLLSMKSKSKWLLVHSKADELVDTAQSEDFKKSLVKQGIDCVAVQLEKENHFASIQAALESKPFKLFLQSK